MLVQPRYIAETLSQATIKVSLCTFDTLLGFCCRIRFTQCLDNMRSLIDMGAANLRGRPKKHGVKPAWVMHRTAIILRAYDEARAQGNKHSYAVIAAVSYVRSREPGMRISETEVKRVLSELRSRDSEQILIVTEREAERREVDGFLQGLIWAANRSRGKLSVPSFVRDRSKHRRFVIYELRVGPRPHYPRINSKI